MVCQTGLTMRKRPLRHDGEANLHDLHNREVDNRYTATGEYLHHEGNLHDLYTGTWTTVCTAKGASRWSAEQLDPLRYDREVDDLENGLQLRRNRSFLHPVTKAPVIAHNGRVNNSVERKILLVHTGQEAEHLGLPTK